jgi:hypothetical protein
MPSFMWGLIYMFACSCRQLFAIRHRGNCTSSHSQYARQVKDSKRVML